MKLSRRVTALCLSALFLMTPVAEAATIDVEVSYDNEIEQNTPNDTLVSDGNQNNSATEAPIIGEQINIPPTITTTTAAYRDGHQEDGNATVVSGLILVNKKHALPASYAPAYTAGNGQSTHLLGEADTACQAFLAAANAQGFNMYVLSGYRSYNVQKDLFASYVRRSGEALANTYSARAGQSEHQTGLAFDVGDANNSSYNLETKMDQLQSIKWMMANCQNYGFILRYPKDKMDITGYQYEPWHFRYVGVQAAKEIMASGLCLEEFLGDKASIPNSKDNGRRIAIGRNDTKISLDGVAQTISTYNIDGNNYFRMRDLATLLSGTEANFDVLYDAATQSIKITPNTALSGERTLIDLNSKDMALPNTMIVQLGDMIITPQSYNVNGYTYYKLRDMAALLNFMVDWDEITGTVVMATTIHIDPLEELMQPMSVSEKPSIVCV